MEARDGVEAWEYLQAHQVDLVLTDIEMPRLNGFELTRQIKTDERFAHIPVIALTSLAGEEDVEKGKEAGIDDYQIKIDKENLLQGIYRFARKNRQQA
jgi:two-component system chemotaxis sensor kinase CheA